MKMNIKILDERIGKTIPFPRYASAGAAAFDLYACIDGNIMLDIREYSHSTAHSSNTALIPTGIAMEVPEGYVGLIFPRSGLATKNGIQLQNCVGVIDSDYRGEIKVALVNNGDNIFRVEPGMRIAQMVIMPVQMVELEVTSELSDTERGVGGFGSTGLN